MTNDVGFQILNFQPCGDDRGSLIALEQLGNVPFDIKRIYYMFDTKEGISRGFHAHKALKQVVIAVSGSCNFTLDDGKTRTSVLLDNPCKGLYIDDFVWREIDQFSSDCVLLALASEHYDENDYIRNYNAFIKAKNT